MNLFSLSGLLIGITCSLLVILLLKYGRTKLHRVWAFFNLTVAIWGFGGFFAGQTTDKILALLLWKVAHIGVIFISITFYHVVSVFSNLKQKALLIIIYILGFIFLYLDLFTDILIPKIEYLFNSFYYAKSERIIYTIFFIFWISLVAVGHIHLLKYYKSAPSIRKNQILYLFYGVFTGFAGGTMNFFPILGWDIYPYGNLTIPVYCIIVTYAIVRYRLMDVTVAITRTGIFVFTYSLILGIPFVVAHILQPYLVGFFGEYWWLVPMGVLTVLATVGPFVYIYINRKAENRLMREQRQYQNTLRQASSGMIRIRDLRKLLNLIVHVVTKTVKIEFASIFLLDTQNNRYSLAAIRDSSSMPEDFSLEPNSTIIEQLFNKRETLVYEEIQLQAQDSPKDLKLNSLEQQLRQLQAAVVIPSFVSNKLLGFLVLGKKLSGKVYSQDDLNVFSVLANQMALAVENTSSFEELKNTRNQLVQLEKLAATGKLAHQVAHEIKNPLTAIKTFTDYLDEKYQSQEFRQKFKKIVGSEIDRLQDVVLQLMDVSKANTPRFKERVDVHQIIEATVLLLENQLLDAGIHIECKLNAQNPILKADPDQLKQVFLNLILNAKDAMPSGGTLTITTQVQRTENRSQKIESNLRSSVDYQSVIICVSDTGCGIPETDLPHIFEQFFTTKEKGSGLGLSIVQGIILAHNGKITCQSQVDKGTTFLIELPVS